MEGKIMEKLQRFSIRKLSIGAVSCIIGTVTFLGYSNNVQAAEKPQTVETAKAENEIQPENTQEGTPNEEAKGDTQNEAVDKNAVKSQANNAAVVNASDQSKSISDQNKLEDSSVVASTSERNQLQTSQSADTTDVQPASDQVESAAINSNTPESNVSAASASTVLSKQPANADTQLAATTSGVQPFVNLAVESDNNDLTPKHETIDSKWTLHYVNQADHKQELKDPTVITMQYTRTNTPQSDGTVQYGDWSYVPGSFKQTGTPITVKDSNNPVKQDNVDKNGENFDVFTITAMYPTVAGYGFYNGINGTRLRDNLRNNERQAPTMSKDFYAEYDVAKPTRETVDSQWRIHYIDSTNHEHELKAPTVINLQYTRTNTPQSDGTIQHGDWSYVSGSFKQTGTQITVNDSDNPVKEDNVDKDGKNMDVFTIDAMYPSITGYNFHDSINNARLHDHLLNYDPNGNIQRPTMGQDFDVEYDPIGERSVAVKFVDDQSYDFHTSYHKKQVGQAMTLTGHDGDTVDLKLTVPDKYQLADGQQLPTTYTFAKGSGDLKIHLVHKVVQREATIDVQLLLTTSVHTRDNDYAAGTITQARWKQLEEQFGDDIKYGAPSPAGMVETLPSVEVGTLTGHVDYDLVDERVTSLGDDWTTLNLGGRTYQLPNGDEVVNGIMIDGDTTWGKSLKEETLKSAQIMHVDLDPDYVTRAWHGYLSVNATNNDSNGLIDEVHSLGLQAGLVGDEPNALAKATGDRAATAVEMSNKPIDLNLLQGYDFDFSEQDGQLRAKAVLLVSGVYIPYVEKTATRTINATTPDGKTTAVKQTVTLAKQIGSGKDVHSDWTTGEWANYTVPTIPGYTASQSQIAKTAVTGTTEDQTVNITYTANPQASTVVYQTEDGTPVHTTTVNGHTGQTVKVSNEVPVGWHVVNGTVPSEITFGPNGTPKTVVTIAHSHATVTPDAPKTTSDKLPDNPAKTYPAGVSHDDLNKTITGTIKVTMPDGQIKTVVKAAHLTRTADVDEVTGEVTYSDWTTGYWSDYTAPSVPGYTANYPYIAGQLVTGETTDQTIEITYTANDGTQTIVYQDEDGSEIDKQVISGKTDEKVKVTPDVPDGYVLKGEVPSEVTIKPDDTPITVTVEHGKSHVTPDKPVNKGDLIPDTKDKTYPAGLTHDDLNKTVTREITITDPSGKKTTSVQTVTFTRGATVDDVTGKVTYDSWAENGKHTFDKVDVPTVQGYTASGDVPSLTVTPDSQSTNVTVTYNANEQTATITYIDDTDKKTLGSDSQNGKFNQAITFATAPSDEIENYKKQGYVLVSNSFNNNKYQADNNNNVFYVHLRHDTKKVSRNDDVNMTVHYVMDDNSAAPNDNKQTVNFTENGLQDLVTQKITWTPADSQTLNDVASPVLTGYTADIKTANGKSVNFGDSDINVTVHYSANAQTAKITYIDDTTKTNLDSKDTSGKFGQAIAFETAPADEIENYVKQGYKLVSNDFNSNKYQADNSKNVFHVHFVHDTKKVSREHSASFTVHYIYKDGSQAKPDHEQTLNFTENGIQDLVTQKITWTPADSQKFDDAITPVITGYTPDQDKVIGQTANFETGNREVTVTYLPNVQIGHINYIDDNTGKTLTRDDFSGRTNEHEDYTSIDRIQEFENKGYVFVSSDYPDGGFNFDDNDQQDQIFNVHLKHGIVTVTTKNPQIPNTTIDPDPHSPKYPDDISNTNSDVKRAIDYKFKDGKTAQPTVNDSLHFERTVVIDKVTGDVLSDTWTPSQNFNGIQTPAIQGYTPDKAVVSDKNIGHDHQNIVEHVVYSPDTQHMTITYVDDTTGKKLHTDKLDGVSDQDAKYTTGDSIKQYINSHYKLVSDSTNGQDLIFDHDDNVDQTYEVHFIHSTHKIDQITGPKQTIHYVYADDLARQGKAADDNVQQLSFTRDGYNDEVTGIDHWNAWTPANSQYKAVDSPVIQGYTPDKLAVEESTVNPTDKDTEITVVYNADEQATHVIYIDKTTNTTLASKDLSGKSDEDSGYNTKDTIEKYQSQHYVLTSDETNGDNVIFDHDDKQDQTYYVYFVHGTQKVNRQDTVTSTIDYKFEDGKIAQPTVTQTKQFSEDGVKDLVTGKIVWTKAEPQKFDDVTTSTISGYTPNRDKVAGSTVNFGDKDITETVTYTPDKQKAKVIFIDDTTKTTLDTHNLTGVTNGHENYDPSDEIDEFVHKHYVLVPSDDPEKDYPAKGFTYDNNDNKDQVFEVHFVHGSHTISEKKSITETIIYKMSDSSKAPDKVEKQIEFSRVGKHDDVTNTDTWNEWQPNKQSFDVVPTPEVKGYTPDIKSVEAKTVIAGDKDIAVTVTYSPDQQKAKVVFIDDTTKKILDTHDLTGVTNGHEKYSPSEEIEKFIHDDYVFVSSDYPEKGFTYDNDDNHDQVFEVHLREVPIESDTPTVPDNTDDNGGSNGTPTDSDNPEKDNGGSDTGNSSHKTPVKRHDNKKHHGTKKTNIQKNANKKHHGTKKTNSQKTSKTAKLNPNRLAQPKLEHVKESTNNVNRMKHGALPQTGEKHSSLMAMLGLAISGLGMIGAMKSKKRKDD